MTLRFIESDPQLSSGRIRPPLALLAFTMRSDFDRINNGPKVSMSINTLVTLFPSLL